jgi:ABC-2 type transport system permease protein
VRRLFNRILSSRIWPLFVKEFHQIKRNRRLVVILVLPPTLNIILFGFALNPEVTNLRLGVVDQSRSAESRDLVSAFSESRSFQITSYYASTEELGRALSAGELNAGLVIPFDFAKKRARRETAEVQLLIDAVDSNAAAIAGGYAARIISAFNQRITQAGLPTASAQTASPSVQAAAQMPAPAVTTAASPLTIVFPAAGLAVATLPQQAASPFIVAPAPGPSVSPTPPVILDVSAPSVGRASITARIALLYNPGLKNSWFIATGMIGTLLVIQASAVAAGSMVKEKEAGTVEQLLMTPAQASEIVIAKIAPIFLLLAADIGLALFVAWLVFSVPVHGSLLLLFFAGSMCVLSGIGVGTLIATFTRSQQQAQLMSFFVNPPIALLSGATTPVEAMPHWLQPFTYINPVRHFTFISRGIMLKGTGLDVLYPNLLALICFACLLVGISAWRFRKQLG